MLTPKEKKEKREIDRLTFAGKATSAQLLRGLDLKQKRDKRQAGAR